MNITIKQLRAFAAVADAGSFTEAATRLYLTQSGLSLLVKELEGELGVRLFDRSTRRISLTVAGADFYPLALRVLQDLDSAVNSALQLQDVQRGAIRIACTPLYSAGLMPAAMDAYKREFPAIHIKLLDSLNEVALQRVASDEVDFSVAPTRPISQNIVQQPLFRDRFRLICPVNHPLVSGRRVSWKEALQFPFVTLPTDYTRQLQADLAAHSPSLILRPAQQVAFLTTALGMVKFGHGIAALPSSAIHMVAFFGLAAVDVEAPVVDRQICFFQRRGKTLSPAAESFREFLIRFTSDLSSLPESGTVPRDAWFS
ncbi:LysR family transcriptional regulator [Pandoraea terrigena]|uniref:LysR family transcriptional regulator n=1 Tax=Pandoraea terrigena TaxID=2508292 RepID=A0A5E4UFH7_9BURK|nr:LysR family transcriptional regulator [Pandoraea terrigena]VVD96989.1 LysR family transcriptional regulator [Pandoraea terrigena]